MLLEKSTKKKKKTAATGHKKEARSWTTDGLVQYMGLSCSWTLPFWWYPQQKKIYVHIRSANAANWWAQKKTVMVYAVQFTPSFTFAICHWLDKNLHMQTGQRGAV